MEGKKEKFKGFLELKKFAAEKLLRIASNKLFIDIRKVRRFRIWQGEYLDHVMREIAIRDSEKQQNLKMKYFMLLNILLLKHIQKALFRWSSYVKYFKIIALPKSKFSAAISISTLLLKKDTENISKKNFPLFYSKTSTWRASRIRSALFYWKQKVISSLLNESHKEQAIIKITDFLYKKTTPLTSFAIKKVCSKIGVKIGCNVLAVALKKISLLHKHFVFMWLSKKKVEFTPRSRFSREQKSKFMVLQKFVAINRLNQICTRSSQINIEALNVVKCFVYWKKMRKRTPSNKLSKRSKGANRKIKQLGIKYSIYKLRDTIRRSMIKELNRWKMAVQMKSSGKKDFPIDKSVYINQAQVAAYIEGQIIEKGLQIKNEKKKIQAENLAFIVCRQMKKIFREWVNSLQREKQRTNDQDIIYEYIHYLEDNLGVHHKFRHFN